MRTSPPAHPPALLLAALISLAACASLPSVPTASIQVPLPTAAPAAPTAAPAPTVAPTVAPTAVPTVAPTRAPAPTSTPEAMPTSDPITGAPALARGALKRRPYVVMIDNHPNAYPQTGLGHAVVVFEALAEFGVTRFMAIFVPDSSSGAAKIGPVRSTRVYFAQWAMGFRPLYAHAGGSPQGLALVERTDALVNLDALHLKTGEGSYFWRSGDRAAPHNLYTSSAQLSRAAKDRGARDVAQPDIGFMFKVDLPADQRPKAQRLGYFFLYPQDSAGWTYDPRTNGYLRLRRGKPARDAASGEQLWTKNVVVMEVKEAPVRGDAKGRIEQEVVGSGRARVFIDGRERHVRWRKDSSKDQLSFYDAAGAEVTFNAGPIWIAALPALSNLKVT